MVRQTFRSYQPNNSPGDWISILCLILLGLFGLFLLLTTNTGLFWQQLLFLVVGVGIVYSFSKLDSIILWWIAPYGYIFSVLLLIATYFSAPIRGASRWIMLGGVQIQPSEIIKPLLLLAFARAATTYSPRSLKWFLLHAVLLGVPALLVFKQPDLGTALVYAFSWFSIMVSGGLSIIFIFAVGVGIALLFPWLWHALAPYQKRRVETFLNPALDPTGAGYNALQAMIAVGSGELLGRGLGRGTQSHLRFLPEYHTDFIFATLVEELGFLGGMALLIIYLVLLWRLIAPYVRGTIDNPFIFYYSIGLFGMLMTQICINTGMNMGIIPVTGITLPLVSYGGSSILSLAMAFGFLAALRRGARDDGSIAIR